MGWTGGVTRDRIGARRTHSLTPRITGVLASRSIARSRRFDEVGPGIRLVLSAGAAFLGTQTAQLRATTGREIPNVDPTRSASDCQTGIPKSTPGPAQLPRVGLEQLSQVRVPDARAASDLCEHPGWKRLDLEAPALVSEPSPTEL